MRFFNEPLVDNPHPKYPCGICSKLVGQRMKAVQCDLCNFWNHIKCDGIDDKSYTNLKQANKSDLYYCKICKEDIFAFQTLTDEDFHSRFNNINYINDNLNLKLSVSPDLRLLFSDLDNLNKEDNNAINCSYYMITPRQFQTQTIIIIQCFI